MKRDTPGEIRSDNEEKKQRDSDGSDGTGVTEDSTSKSTMSYANKLLGTRDVPCQFKILTSVPNMPIKVNCKRKISDEYSVIENAVNLQLHEKLGIVCQTEVTLISHDGITRCQNENWTEDIKFIGVTFKGLENTVLQDIMKRMTSLETEVKSLKNKMETLEIGRSEKFIRILIEKGRNILWKKHENAYMNNQEVVNNMKRYIEENEYYDSKTKEITIFRKPKHWSHFISFIASLNLESEVISFLSLLEGGPLSRYAEYSIDIYEGSETEIAEAIKYLNLNDTENVALFSFVFGKSVDEV